VKNDHPIVISECPKWGAMKAARSKYLQPLKDEVGNPDPTRVYLMKIECLGCFEIGPTRLPYSPLIIWPPIRLGVTAGFTGC
jgi:hypothetical protein